MADIFTSQEDEKSIENILLKGLMVKAPKWVVMRLALAHSLKILSPPDEELDLIDQKGSEYHLEQVTGQGQGRSSSTGQRQDYTDAFRGLLSVYSDEDLFADERTFKKYLQRHIRRGLREFRNGWRDSHNFHEYLYQELCAGLSSTTNQTETDFKELLITALMEIGISGQITQTIDGPRITRYSVRLEDPNHLDHILRGLDKIAFSLGLNKHGIFPVETQERKVIGLDIPRPRSAWDTISGVQLLEWAQKPPKGMILPVCLGVNVIGEPIFFDLVNQPHLLVGGTTGSGKSVCLHALLLSLLIGVEHDQLELFLIDPKKVEFAPYAKAGSKRITVVTDIKEAQKKLNALVIEMDARATAMELAGVRDLAEGHKKGVIDKPYIAVFVEELADLIMQSPETEELLIRLAQKARATGIHLVIATQRPDARTINGLLRSNIPARIALTVQKATESKIILDENGAERLTGNGDMLTRLSGEELLRAHGAYVTVDDIKATVRNEGRH
ncbi:MAG: DndE family protein [Magnetococcales bacterium]|nr:DndE family protein [Magnetococcales bacterium]